MYTQIKRKICAAVHILQNKHQVPPNSYSFSNFFFNCILFFCCGREKKGAITVSLRYTMMVCSSIPWLRTSLPVVNGDCTSNIRRVYSIIFLQEGATFVSFKCVMCRCICRVHITEVNVCILALPRPPHFSTYAFRRFLSLFLIPFQTDLRPLLIRPHLASLSRY